MKSPSEYFFPPLTATELEDQLPALREKLKKCGTLNVEPNQNGIYAASASQTSGATSGYQNAWLRDNAMVAFSRWKCGDPKSALRTLQGLAKFLQTQTSKMERIIARPSTKEQIQRRPHVRFDARTLGEIGQTWAHAQNDALAYVVWLRFLLANEGGKDDAFDLTQDERELYGLFPRYFDAIQFWKDRDSGAWEEARKVNSSSVGAVVAALIEIERYLQRGRRIPKLNTTRLAKLIDRGRRTLREQLPFESPPARKADGALLLLIYPLEVVADEENVHLIVSLVRARLQGTFGIRRYLGDSYFCQDYDLWFPPGARSADFSNRMEIRDEFLQPGCEAQWCLFDSLLSIIHANQFLKDPNRVDCFERQLQYLNRAIAQITPEGACPELYFLKRGHYAPNEHTPLAWAQANLAIALQYLEIATSATKRGTNHC